MVRFSVLHALALAAAVLAGAVGILRVGNCRSSVPFLEPLCEAARSAVEAVIADSSGERAEAESGRKQMKAWLDDWDEEGLRPVPVLAWRGVSSVKQAADSRVPVIFKNSPVAEWALQPLDDVLGPHPELEGTRIQRGSPVFVLRAQAGRFKPDAGYLDRVLLLPDSKPYEVEMRTVNTSDFLERNNDTSQFWYLTVPLEAWQEPLRAKVAKKMVIGEDETVKPELEDGPELPWNEQVWGLLGLNQTQAHSIIFPTGTIGDPARDSPSLSDPDSPGPGRVPGNGSPDDASKDPNQRGVFAPPEPHAMLWLAHQGTTAHMHYDRTHNFFAQLHGRKRVVLLPPQHHARVRMFPTLHPSYRQSQHTPEDVLNAFKFSAAQSDSPGEAMLRNVRSDALVAELQPGDLLYLPPLWFHSFTALDLSLSLSVVSPSEEEMLHSKASWSPVPFGRVKGTVRDRAIVVSMFLSELIARAEAVLSQLESKPSNSGFFNALLASRYLPLYGADSPNFRFPSCSLPADFSCYRTTGSDRAARETWTEQLGANITESSKAVWESFSGLLHESPAWSSLGLAASATSPDVHAGIVRILLGDYVEHLAAWAVGACNVAKFLQVCLMK